jgi:ABC-2 type transport system permease protein
VRKVAVVASREFQAAVKTKAFIFTMVAMPLIWGGMIGFQVLMKDKVDTRDKRVGVLDLTPGQKLFEVLVQAASERTEKEVFKGEGAERRQAKPRYVLEKAENHPEGVLQATLALSDRVRNDELFAFLVIGADVLHPEGDSAQGGVQYHSNSPTYDDIQDWAAAKLNDRIRQLRLSALNLDPELIRKATQRTYVANLGLVSRDASGAIVPAEITNEMANIFVPMGVMMLMFMAVMIGATPLTQSVIEEKMNRIAEVLLGSVTPFQLMMGKLTGTVGVSITIVSFYLLGGYATVRYLGYGQLFPLHILGWFIVFQSLAVLLYGSVFVAIGAAVSDMKEAQSVITPVMLLLVFPMLVWLNVVKEPTSTLSMVLSFIPSATPMLMVLRQSVPPGIPIWQPALGVILVLASTVFCVFAAGRIFRVGILMQGRGAKIREMLGWVIRG